MLFVGRFFHVSVAMVQDFLRTVSESQSLSTKNCFLWADSFLLSSEKIALDEDELPSDSFAERYRHCDLLYPKKSGRLRVVLHNH